MSQKLFALIWFPIATDLSTVKDIVKNIDMYGNDFFIQQISGGSVTFPGIRNVG